MKVLLLTGGAMLLTIGIFMMLAAAIIWLVRRSRPAVAVAGAPAAAPMRAAPPPLPATQPPPSRPAAPQRAPEPAGATVMMDVGSIPLGALHGVAGALEGRVLLIEPKGFYIGRDSALSQVLIEDPRVSKRHVWVGVKDGAVMAVDQSSTNGTYLNNTGNRIREARLSPGDTLIISQDVTRLTFQLA
jgi:hypothetical protein